MAISIKWFKGKSEKELLTAGTKGATRTKILDFLSRHKKQAFLGSEIYRGLGYSGSNAGGSIYVTLNQLVKEKKVVKKGSYFTLKG